MKYIEKTLAFAFGGKRFKISAPSVGTCRDMLALMNKSAVPTLPQDATKEMLDDSAYWRDVLKFIKKCVPMNEGFTEIMWLRAILACPLTHMYAIYGIGKYEDAESKFKLGERPLFGGSGREDRDAARSWWSKLLGKPPRSGS